MLVSEPLLGDRHAHDLLVSVTTACETACPAWAAVAQDDRMPSRRIREEREQWATQPQRHQDHGASVPIGGFMSATQLGDVHAKVTHALRTIEGDSNASPVFVAVVREFASKAAKAVNLAAEGREREAVIELEQAGDSAKAAAEADPAAAGETTTAVLDAHLAICRLKARLDQSA